MRRRQYSQSQYDYEYSALQSKDLDERLDSNEEEALEEKKQAVLYRESVASSSSSSVCELTF